jgi:hypothetical protein
MMFKQDRRRFWKNLTINTIKLNPARSILLPVALTLFIMSLTIDKSIVFREIYKHFQSKDGTHYYVLNNDTIESEEKLEIFEDDDGYYIKRTEHGEGKFLMIVLTSMILVFVVASFFAEDWEIPKAVEATILQDVKLANKEQHNWSTNFVYTAYTKKVLTTYSPKTKKEMYGLSMQISDFMELEDCIEKDEIRDRKLDEIGIN